MAAVSTKLVRVHCKAKSKRPAKQITHANSPVLAANAGNAWQASSGRIHCRKRQLKPVWANHLFMSKLFFLSMFLRIFTYFCTLLFLKQKLLSKIAHFTVCVYVSLRAMNTNGERKKLSAVHLFARCRRLALNGTRCAIRTKGITDITTHSSCLLSWLSLNLKGDFRINQEQFLQQ